MGGGNAADRKKARKAQERLAERVAKDTAHHNQEPVPNTMTVPAVMQASAPEPSPKGKLGRAIELAAFAFAILGCFLDAEFFRLAIALITIACLVFVWEGWCERRTALGWIKLLGGAGAWFFYASIVFAKYDLLIHPKASMGNYPPGTVRAGIPWKDEYSEFTLSITNPSGADYQNVNVTLTIKKLSVAAFREDMSDLSNTTTCNVIRENDAGMEFPQKFFGRDDSGRVVEQNAPYIGTIGVPYRMICGTLPHRSAVVFVAAIRNGKNPFSSPPDVSEPRPKKLVEDFCFDATYTVGRRIRNYRVCPTNPTPLVVHTALPE